MKKSREEVLQKTKLRLREKYDIHTIELVEKNFWIALRYYITHPLEFKGGIQINRFFKLTLRLNKLKWKVANAPLPSTTIERYKQLIENNE